MLDTEVTIQGVDLLYSALLCILNATKTNSTRTVHARRHQQQFAVFAEFVGLGKIPDRALRGSIHRHAEWRRAYVRR